MACLSVLLQPFTVSNPLPAAETPGNDTPQALVAIGEQLRQARLDRGLSLDELAGRLNMGQEQLRALESADLSRLPEPVFVIAQIRRVAGTLAVDVEAPIQQLRQSNALQPKARVASERSAGASAPPAPASPKRPAAWSMWLAAVVAVPLVGWFGLAGWQRWHTASLQQPEPQARSERTKTDTREAQAPKPQAIKPEANKPDPKPAANPLANQLTLNSSEASWLAVRDSQGTMLFEGTFKGQKTFPLGQGLTVLAGRPDLVQASLAGSKPEPIGPIEAVRWKRFSPPPQP